MVEHDHAVGCADLADGEVERVSGLMGQPYRMDGVIVDGRRRCVEAYILDFDGDLDGRHLGVEFWYCLRGTVRFDSIDALVGQTDRDFERTRALMLGARALAA